ncbi:11712_t:CDS:2, partial [Acaulospora morrowiae]
VALFLGITCAEFQPSSYKSIEDCALATSAEVIFSTDPLYNDDRVGERILYFDISPTIPKINNIPQKFDANSMA